MGNFAPLFGEPCKPNPNPPRMELENSSTRNRGEVDSKPVFEDGEECVENSQNKINQIIMKKFLLSIFAVLFAFAGVQAEEVTLQQTDVINEAAAEINFIPEGSPISFNFSNAYAKSGDTYIRVYADSEITISGATITKVVMSATSSSYIKTWDASYGNLTISGADATWTGNAELLTLTNTSSGQARIKTITVYYEEEGGVAQPKFSVAAGSYSASFDLELNADGNDIYYTLDGTEPDENSTEYTEAIPVKASVLVKAIAVDSNGESSSVAEANYEVASNIVSGKYVKAINLTDWTGNYLIVYEAGSVAFNGNLDAIDATGNYVNVEIANDAIAATADTESASFDIQKIDDGYSVRAKSGLYIGRDATSNGMDKSASTVYVNSIDENGVISGNGGPKLQYYSASGSERFRYYKTTQKTVSLYRFVRAAHTLNVTDCGWATLCLNYDAEIPEGVTCYAVSAVDGESATLAEVKGVIPANTGVIVEANEGSYTFEVASEAAAVSENKLEGTTVNKYIFEDAYVLGVVDGVVGLYKAEMAGGAWLNNANKAYLPASKVSNKSVAFYGFDWDGTTGIEQITDNREQSTAIYDLTGRRIEAITAPGIYIVNGVKKLVR